MNHASQSVMPSEPTREARLARILIYPIKSLPAVELDSARVLANGALAGDRRWAIHDDEGNFVNGKRTAQIHLLRAAFGPRLERLTLSTAEQSPREFCLPGEIPQLEAWLSAFFGLAVHLVENRSGGFPDDSEAPGPTLVSHASLAAVAGWFPAHGDTDEMRRRFRANLEVDGVEAFWEDRLFADSSSVVRFAIGDVEFFGVNPCQRCIVPTRNSLSGAVDLGFAKAFATRRGAGLPHWAQRERFNHFYRLAVNTRGVSASEGRSIRVGDRVTLLGPASA
jgi:uncharacterized protein YcbX